MSDADQALAPAAVLVSHSVADFDRWKVTFDAAESARRAAGVLGHHVNRAEDDPNRLTVFLAVSDIERAQTFANSAELKSDMEQAGVTGPPELTWMTPVREAIDWERELPAFVLSHRVTDFDQWLVGYDDAQELRAEMGIIGQAANRSLEDPSVALVYHQAESFDTLREFLGNSDLQIVMKEAGVISEPEVSFHTGGWAKRY